MITTVTLSGQPVPLGPAIAGSTFIVRALSSNTGIIYIERRPGEQVPTADGQQLLWSGPSAATKDGEALSRGEFLQLPGPRLDRYWIDSDVNNQKVSILCL
jgi:hypothetical protein